MFDDPCTCTLAPSDGARLRRSTGRLDRRPRSVLQGPVRREPCPDDGRLAWEMHSARAIQRHGLPGPLDLEGGLGIAGANLPATHLSGDIYDFVLNGRRLYFLLCDVSGKGLGSAMIAAHLGRVFRMGARRGWSLDAIDHELHETALEADGSEKYATGILGVLDVDDRRLRLLAAGHDAPSVVGADDDQPITDSTGLVHCWGSPLGVRLPPPVTTVAFGLGQSMLFYTDGVSDPWCGGGRFGRGRIQAAHAECADSAAEIVCDQVLAAALRSGRPAASPKDDMTVLALHWRG